MRPIVGRPAPRFEFDANLATSRYHSGRGLRPGARRSRWSDVAGYVFLWIPTGTAEDSRVAVCDSSFCPRASELFRREKGAVVLHVAYALNGRRHSCLSAPRITPSPRFTAPDCFRSTWSPWPGHANQRLLSFVFFWWLEGSGARDAWLHSLACLEDEFRIDTGIVDPRARVG